MALLTCMCQWRGTCRVCSNCSSPSWLWKIGMPGVLMLSVSQNSLELIRTFQSAFFHYLLPTLTSDTFTFISLVLSEQWVGLVPGTMEEVIFRDFNYIHTWGVSRKNTLQVINYQHQSCHTLVFNYWWAASLVVGCLSGYPSSVNFAAP